MATNVNKSWAEVEVMQCNKLTEEELQQCIRERQGTYSLGLEVMNTINSLIKCGATIRKYKDMVIMDIPTLIRIVEIFRDE